MYKLYKIPVQIYFQIFQFVDLIVNTLEKFQYKRYVSQIKTLGSSVSFATSQSECSILEPRAN